MSRTVNGTLLTNAQAKLVRPALLATFDFQAGVVRVWTGIGNLVYGGNTYTGVGEFGSVSTIAETTDLRANGVSFQLNGWPSSLLSTILAETYHGRDVTLLLATFDSSMVMSGTPLTVFQGKTDAISLHMTPEGCSITVNAESRAIDFLRNLERRYTHQDQQINFPADTAFIYMSDAAQKTFAWGGSGTTAPAGGGSFTMRGANFQLN